MGSNDNHLSQLLTDSDYFTILQQSVGTGVTPEILRSFQLRLTPTANYGPNGVTITDIDTGDIPNRGTISGRKKFEPVITAGINEYENVLGNTAFDWRRGTHMLLIQLKGSNFGDLIASIFPLLIQTPPEPMYGFLEVSRSVIVRRRRVA
ncbi:hypothetical protein AX17_005578 [Amanita inopinata Kibby_2008]|nr:hypothetical protein AX17_005578 [Amanita inopinata Kibby_2008]